MLKGQNLVYFGPGVWDGLWRNRQHLLSRFAQHNRVLFVEGRSHLGQTVADLRRGDFGLRDLARSPTRRISENLVVFCYPLWAPISGRTPLAQLTQAVRRLTLRYSLWKLGMSNPIVWFHRPDMVDLLDEAPSPRLRLYHVVDEYTTYGGVTARGRRRIEAQEKTLMAQVDAVIVVSQKLYEAKRPFNPNTYLVPNGVDFEAYSVALSDPELPEDLQAIKPPRLGYIGLIGAKLNLDMLKELAAQHPEWSLVFLGQARPGDKTAAWQACKQLPNVHHLGPVEVSQVPSYVKGFHVGLMPYEQNRHAAYISPLKLYDYLAAGISIASLDIPAIQTFRAYVHTAASPCDYVQAVQAALNDTAPEQRQIRREVAEQNSWDARVEQLSEIIQAQLEARAGA